MTNKIKNHVIKNLEITEDTDNYRSGFNFLFTRLRATIKDGRQFQLHATTQYTGSAKWVQDKLERFLATDRKSFQDYCRGNNKEHDVKGFLDWIEEHNYTYESCAEIYRLGENQNNPIEVWNFHGNLKEISSAFNFYVFDKELVGLIEASLSKRSKAVR